MTTYTHSDSRLKFYYDLCTRKSIVPMNVMEIAPVAFGQEIERLLALPAPASPKQLDMIREMITELVNAGVEGIKMPSEKFFASLTGGREGSASRWIEELNKKRAQNFDRMPATDVQIDRIAEWYACPDVDWDTISVTKSESVTTYDEEGLLTHRHVSSTETTRINRKIMLDEYIGDVQLWRYMTPEEFKQELKSKLTHSSASNIIDRFSGVYTGWLRTRASESQKKQIRDLERKLSTVYVPREVTVMDMESETGEDNPFGTHSNKFAKWNPTAYVGLSDVQLTMLSREDANKHMNQLRYELQAKELYNVSGAQDLSGDFEEMRTAKNLASARTKEFTELNNMMYALQGAVGEAFELVYSTDDGEVIQSVQALRDDAMRVFFNYATPSGGEGGASDEKKQEIRSQIVDFMKESILRDAVTFKELMEMCDKSDTAQEILDALTDDVEFSRILIKKQLANK